MTQENEAKLRALGWEPGMARPDVCHDERAYQCSPWSVDSVDEDGAEVVGVGIEPMDSQDRPWWRLW